MNKDLSQQDLLIEYFKKHPNQDVPHPDVVDWVIEEYKKRTGQTFRDPDRGIRKLSQEGFLIKITKGVYRYEPDHVKKRELQDFTLEQKRAILKRDNYRCVICGKGRAEGVELHVDHIKPKDLGGRATIQNGQTLCAPHNFLKKNLNQTETGKKMFIRLYDLAKSLKDKPLQQFCADILRMYEKHNINGHIKWKR